MALTNGTRVRVLNTSDYSGLRGATGVIVNADSSSRRSAAIIFDGPRRTLYGTIGTDTNNALEHLRPAGNDGSIWWVEKTSLEEIGTVTDKPVTIDTPVGTRVKCIRGYLSDEQGKFGVVTDKPYSDLGDLFVQVKFDGESMDRGRMANRFVIVEQSAESITHTEARAIFKAMKAENSWCDTADRALVLLGIPENEPVVSKAEIARVARDLGLRNGEAVKVEASLLKHGIVSGPVAGEFEVGDKVKRPTGSIEYTVCRRSGSVTDLFLYSPSDNVVIEITDDNRSNFIKVS